MSLMKNTLTSIKEKITQRNNFEHEDLNNNKSTNINVLLNRVRQDKKNESRKKLLFTAVTSLGAVLFGILIF